MTTVLFWDGRSFLGICVALVNGRGVWRHNTRRHARPCGGPGLVVWGHSVINWHKPFWSLFFLVSFHVFFSGTNWGMETQTRFFESFNSGQVAFFCGALFEGSCPPPLVISFPFCLGRSPMSLTFAGPEHISHNKDRHFSGREVDCKVQSKRCMRLFNVVQFKAPHWFLQRLWKQQICEQPQRNPPPPSQKEVKPGLSGGSFWVSPPIFFPWPTQAVKKYQYPSSQEDRKFSFLPRDMRRLS